MATEADAAFLQRLRADVAAFRLLPVARHGQPPAFVPALLRQAEYVFIWRDAHRTPLQRPYDGPFKVIARREKVFDIDFGAHGTDSISVDHLIPCVVDVDFPPPVAVSPRCGRPPRDTQPPPTLPTLPTPPMISSPTTTSPTLRPPTPSAPDLIPPCRRGRPPWPILASPSVDSHDPPYIRPAPPALVSLLVPPRIDGGAYDIDFPALRRSTRTRESHSQPLFILHLRETIVVKGHEDIFFPLGVG